MKKSIIKMISIISVMGIIAGCSYTSLHNKRYASALVAYYTPTSTFVVTKDDNIWEIKNFEISGKVLLTFDTKGTSDKTDDIIVEWKNY